MLKKRPRNSTDSSDCSQSDRSVSHSVSHEPTSKAARTERPDCSVVSSGSLICTLPPTCNPPKNRPTPLTGTADLEAHYATYHTHVCEEYACGCVFPDARLLELHQTECHDPLAAVRKERGEKIFACHLATCPKRFLTPKARRLHLIGIHGYPKEYFFAVTNKGIGGLLQRWGEGGSLLRGQWHPRDGKNTGGDEDSTADKDEPDVHELDMDTNTAEDTVEQFTALHVAAPSPASLPPKDDSDAVSALTSSLSSLALVPLNIRFGRGAKRVGLAQSTFARPSLLRHALAPSHSCQQIIPPEAACPIASTRPSPSPLLSDLQNDKALETSL